MASFVWAESDGRSGRRISVGFAGKVDEPGSFALGIDRSSRDSLDRRPDIFPTNGVYVRRRGLGLRMSDIAIRVEGLSKKFRIGAPARYRTLRDTVTDALTAPFRFLRN